MKNLFVLMLVFTTAFSLPAQETDSLPEYFRTDYTEGLGSQSSTVSETSKKLRFAFDTGVSFGGSTSGSVFNSFVSPKLKYKFNPKFSFNVGMSLINRNISNMYVPFGESNSETFSGNITQSFLYVEGEYNVSERLKISGIILHQLNTFGTEDPQMKALFDNQTGFSIRADYKINDYMQIGIMVQKNGNSPMGNYNNPFAPQDFFMPRMNSPFFNSGF